MLGPSAQHEPCLLPLWPCVVTRPADGFCYRPRARRLEGTLPQLLSSPLQYKLHSSEHFLQSAGHAVLRTLCSLAHRIGLDGTSCLLDGLCKNVSFSFSIVVVVCVLVCPSSEVVVLAEQQFEGFGDHVGRRSIDELSIELKLSLYRFFDTRLDGDCFGLFWCDFNIDKGLLLSFSYKVSDLLSDKCSGLCLQARKTRPRSSCEGGSDHTATVTHRASKGGVAPALTSCQPSSSPTVFWNVYRIKFSSFAGSAPVK